jgi:hypothetical protein
MFAGALHDVWEVPESVKQVDYAATFAHAPIDKDLNWDNLTEKEQPKCGV